MSTFKWIVAFCAAAMLAFSPVIQAAGGTEAEARAAFVKLHAAAKKGQATEFKKLIAKTDLREMEAMEKERAGMIGMMMEMIAADPPKGFKAEMKGDVVTFVKERKEKSQGGSVTSTTKVTMIREDNQWKFGKPR